MCRRANRGDQDEGRYLFRVEDLTLLRGECAGVIGPNVTEDQMQTMEGMVREAMEAGATLEQALAGIRASGPATGQAIEGASAASRALPPWLLLALLFLACLVAPYLISLPN